MGGQIFGFEALSKCETIDFFLAWICNVIDFGRVSSDDNYRVYSQWTRSQREHIHEFQLSHEGVSEVSERAREWSERA